MRKDFYWVDLKTGHHRQLTNLNTDSVIQTFDISADGRTIIFDRVRNNSDILMLELRD